MAARTSRRRVGVLERRDLLYGLLFASPWILGLTLLYAYPILASLYYSFTDYSVLSSPQWSGLANLRTLFAGDETFIRGAGNSLYYALLFVPISIVFSVSIALMLNMKIKGQAIYRTLYFLPVLVPDVALAILWQWMLNPQVGLVNALLWNLFKIRGPGWIADPNWSKPAVILMSLWGVGQAVIIYLAGLQEVPEDLYDAADVDGANWWQRIWNVTLPMISPVIFFSLITNMIGSLQVFTVPYIMSSGDGRPAQSLMFYSMYLYRNAFVYFKMGYASAMAWILLLVVLIETLLVFRSSRGWVHYQGQ